jgi:DNA-binding MarR family transcriptional regulator
MDRDLSRCLHALTARMDRAADRILRAELGLTYRRYLALVGVDDPTGGTQKDLAEWLGITEPSVSRMIPMLVDAGWIKAGQDPAGGNRRHLALTPAGKKLVTKGGTLLENRFAILVGIADVSYSDYRDSTVRLVTALSTGGGRTPAAAQRAWRKP